MDKKLKIVLIAIIVVIALLVLAVIGVVILAVLGAFMFSTSSGTITGPDGKTVPLEKPFTVGITMKKSASGDIIITNNGGADASRLESVAVSYQPYGVDYAIDVYDEAALEDLKSKGGSLTIKEDAGTADDLSDDLVSPTHVIVTGYFDDGREQVLLAMDL